MNGGVSSSGVAVGEGADWGTYVGEGEGAGSGEPGGTGSALGVAKSSQDVGTLEGEGSVSVSLKGGSSQPSPGASPEDDEDVVDGGTGVLIDVPR